MIRRHVSVNDQGSIVGEDHPRAVLTDHDVWLMLELRAEGMSYRQLADKFDCSRESIADICKGRRRAHLVVGQRMSTGKTKMLTPVKE